MIFLFRSRAILLVTLCLGLSLASGVRAQSNLNAADLVQHVQVSFSPASGTFIEGSTFEVSVYLNTKGTSANAVEFHIDFDPNKLSVVRPSGGTSIVGLWGRTADVQQRQRHY
jgi:predicted secreted protein